MKIIVAFAVLALAGASAATAQRARPVLVGADPELDACPSTGEVRGLNPRGQNYLSVRAAPNARAREVDRVRAGQILWICDLGAGARWLGVVYRRGSGPNCGLGSVSRQRPYAGPCRSGWVSERYVAGVAG